MFQTTNQRHVFWALLRWVTRSVQLEGPRKITGPGGQQTQRDAHPIAAIARICQDTAVI